MRTIEVTVDRQGNTKVETRGFIGSSCRDASRDLERALGVASDERPTAEFYHREQPREEHLDLEQSP